MPKYKYGLCVGKSEAGNPVIQGTDGRVGELRPIKEGEPIYRNPVEAENIGPIFRMKEVDLGRNGPAQVANPQYRSGWEQTFGKDLPN